jgi:hypothetical protein
MVTDRGNTIYICFLRHHTAWLKFAPNREVQFDVHRTCNFAIRLAKTSSLVLDQIQIRILQRKFKIFPVLKLKVVNLEIIYTTRTKLQKSQDYTPEISSRKSLQNFVFMPKIQYTKLVTLSSFPILKHKNNPNQNTINQSRSSTFGTLTRK